MLEAHIERTSAIVAAYVTHNALPASDLPGIIAAVHRALGDLGKPLEPEVVALTPAVPVNKSVFADRLISLENGKSFKSLKRHLSTLGMTPADYRSKWGLPHDYPMVCADYSKVRSGLAKQIGLGTPAGSSPRLVDAA